MRYLITLLLLTSCLSNSRYQEGFYGPTRNVISFNSISLKSSNSAFPQYAKMGDTVIVSFESSQELSEASVTIQDQLAVLNKTAPQTYEASYLIASHSLEGPVSFSIAYMDHSGQQANITQVTDSSSVTIKTIAEAPTAISLKTPSESLSQESIPTFTIDGVEPDSLVNIYSDSCSTSVGSVTSASNSVDVTTSTLGIGEYTFYADQTDFLGNRSPCSAVNVSYERIRQPFVSRWQTTTPGEKVILPFISGYSYDVRVDWGDGTPLQRITTWNDPLREHDYATPGVYTIKVIGTCPSINFWTQLSQAQRDQLIAVDDLGDVGWKNFNQAFMNARNLTSVKGGNVSEVTSMTSMFSGAILANPDTSDWDTSNVTIMSSMFSGATAANPDVSNWDVSKVTNMFYMFSGATAANPDVSNWDVSKVTSMSSMFSGAIAANPDVSNWDVSKVTNMSSMFSGAIAANPDVSKWKTSNVENMANIFRSTSMAKPDVSRWDVSKVTSMSYMFSGAIAANPDVSNWDVSKVTNMSSMFSGAIAANPDVANWDVSKVTDMSAMFASSLTNPVVSSWNTSSVTTFYSMFSGAIAANPDVSKWDTSKVKDMGNIFKDALVANPDVSKWDISKVTRMDGLFGVQELLAQMFQTGILPMSHQ